MELKDMPKVMAAFFDKTKLERINFIVDCVNNKLISLEQADIEIEKIIRGDVTIQ